MTRISTLLLILWLLVAPGADPLPRQAIIEVYGDAALTRRLDSVEVLESTTASPIPFLEGTFQLPLGEHHLRLRRENFLESRLDLKVTETTARQQVWLQPDPAIDHPLRRSGNLLVAFGRGSTDQDDPVWHQTMGSGSAPRDGGLRNVFSPSLRQAYEATNLLLVYDFADPFFSRMLPLDKEPEKVCFNADGSLLFVSSRDELCVYQFGPELSVKLRHPLKAPLTALVVSPQENLVIAAEGSQLCCYDGVRGARLASLPLRSPLESLAVERGKIFALAPNGVAVYQLRPRFRQIAFRKTGANLTSLRIHPLTGQLLAVCGGESTLWKLDPQTLHLDGRVQTPPAPARLWLHKNRAYITHKENRTLSILDLESGETLHQPAVGEIKALVFGVLSDRLYAGLKSRVLALDPNGQVLGGSLWFTHGVPRDQSLIP